MHFRAFVLVKFGSEQIFEHVYDGIVGFVILRSIERFFCISVKIFFSRLSNSCQSSIVSPHTCSQPTQHTLMTMPLRLMN